MFMAPNTYNLFQVPFPELFQAIEETIPEYEYDFKKHQVTLKDKHANPIGYIRLPLHLGVEAGAPLGVMGEHQQVLYITITAGNAAVCVMHGTEIGYHSTLGAYMSRKKQGFSQVKYLNKKGKSRAGSRVRLAATYTFFENINTLLGDLFEEDSFDRIAIDCTASLIPYLHQSKVACPFDKKDERLYKIPLHLPQSNFSNLEAAIKKLKAPILSYDESLEKNIVPLLRLIG